jgi:hypothetical protein
MWPRPFLFILLHLRVAVTICKIIVYYYFLSVLHAAEQKIGIHNRSQCKSLRHVKSDIIKDSAAFVYK